MGERQILLIDLELCIGCQTCTIACKSEHGFGKGAGIRVETIETVNTGKKVTGFSEFSMYFQPVTCMQCEQPACLDACTEEAITKRSDGIVLIDAENCTGCEACVSSCPYDALFYDEYKNIVRKCSFCHERLDDGFEPFCALCCPEKAIYWGDNDDPESEVSKLIIKRNAHTLKSELNTGPAVFYIPQKNCS